MNPWTVPYRCTAWRAGYPLEGSALKLPAIFVRRAFGHPGQTKCAPRCGSTWQVVARVSAHLVWPRGPR